jgi:hypothetical protein
MRILSWICLLSTLAFLNNATADALVAAPDAPALSIKELGTRCIDFPATKSGDGAHAASCGVSEFGSLGAFAGKKYYYAIYCLIPDYSREDGECGSGSFSASFHKARAMAIFVSDAGQDTARLLLKRAEEEIGLVWYAKPEIITNPYGSFLIIPIHLDGTGAGNSSEYYVRDKKSGMWVSLDANSWLGEIRIPSSLAINKGIWPDLKKMTAEAYLYRKGDANCCPTGGKMLLKLGIRRDRLFIKSATKAP